MSGGSTTYTESQVHLFVSSSRKGVAGGSLMKALVPSAPIERI